MNKTLVVGAVGLLLIGLGMPAGAYHIDGGIGNEDPVASAAAGHTLFSDDWWAGNTVRIDNPIGPQTGNDLTGGECENTVGAGGVGATDCNATIVPDPLFTQGIVICEFDASGLEPANAGYGGRCSSAKQAGVPAAAPDQDDWVRMNVTADAASQCNPSWTTPGAAKYFARVGNNVHGLEVEGVDASNVPQSFYYRDLLAYWISSGHVTYFLDVDDAAGGGGNLLECFGADTHAVGITTATMPATVACNSTDPDDGVTAFNPNTYITAITDEQTVCTASA